MHEEKENLPRDLCPHLEMCDIIQGQQERFPGLVERFQQNYCLKNHNYCSRHWIWDFLGAEKVPALMMPHQHDWAQQVLTDSGIGYKVFRQKFPKP